MVTTIEELRTLVGDVYDPELPPLTLADLGILRSVDEVDGSVVVTITPTYSGCPAVEFIEGEIRSVLERAGCVDATVERSLSPAWSTDWITPEGRAKLTESGIAPPRPSAGTAASTPVHLERRSSSAPLRCPRCESDDTEMISPFGSTACKALHRCRSCSEPFDHFKEI